ncbi:putative UDP-GlcNAc:betaGal beta-1,3-N-acetylglucosaminyltransferase LOC100288842 [Pomacea canaliculata]|uniref:putative UDP-GlcNAc:betaGal beta-1,3-N-acetylglucosaminyltransferase LOC100288842 n=1 Tax=Pomacea canaliculata TaxID=400727 RepID=UPI000D72E957|nr:putative UDP-GlcNAc:betaGal beta-1,3-N-acetylglucosaminyltransferase LOC100288842 [Pomacea canaliculata]
MGTLQKLRRCVWGNGGFIFQVRNGRVLKGTRGKYYRILFLLFTALSLFLLSTQFRLILPLTFLKTFHYLQNYGRQSMFAMTPEFISNTSSLYRTTLDDVLRTIEYFPEDEYLEDNSSFFNLRPEVINSFVSEILIQASPLCPGDGPYLLVAIPSVHNHMHVREAIRNTWGSIAFGRKWPRKSVAVDVKLVFFLGVNAATNMSDLKAESGRHGDIVLGNFLDTYRNLSVKIAFILHWTITYCSNAKHLLKVDEDTFVNIPLLIDILHNVSKQQERYIIGHKHTFHKPPVVRRDEWSVNESVYPLPYFPRYTYGHSYVISHKAVRDLLTAYKYMPLVLVEDAFFTGILAKTMGIPRTHCPRFAPPNETNRCLLLEDKFVSQLGFGKNTSDYYDTWSMIVNNKCRK